MVEQRLTDPSSLSQPRPSLIPPEMHGRRATGNPLLHTQTSWTGRISGDSRVFTPNSIKEQSLFGGVGKHLIQRSGIHTHTKHYVSTDAGMIIVKIKVGTANTALCS